MLSEVSAKKLVEEMKNIWDKVNESKVHVDKDFSKNFIYMTVFPIRQYTNNVPAIIISDNAAEILKNRKRISKHGDLISTNKKLKSENSETLSIDHLNPLNDLVKKYLNGNIGLQELFDRSKEQAIITKTEAKKLSGKNHKNVRVDDDWKKSYKICSIKWGKY